MKRDTEYLYSIAVGFSQRYIALSDRTLVLNDGTKALSVFYS